MSFVLDDNDKWSVDIDQLLENIRVNSIILSKYHKKQYLKSKAILQLYPI